MTNLVIHKLVTSLPTGTAIQPSQIYLLLVGADKFSLHVSNKAGSAIYPMTVDGSFLPLTGGSLSGKLTVNTTGSPSYDLLISDILSGRLEASVAGLQLSRYDIQGALATYLRLTDAQLTVGGALTTIGNMTVTNPTSQSTFTLFQSADVAGNPNFRFLRAGISEASLFTINTVGLYLRRADTGNGVTDLIVRDGYITAKEFRANTATTSTSNNLATTTKGYVDEQLATLRPSYVMARSNAPTTQNIYSTTWQELPMVGAGFDVANPDYEISGNGIKCLFDGWVEACAQMHITSIGQRSALQMRLRNGAHTSLQISATGYIRTTSGHNESSLRAVDHIQVSNGDIITAESQRESTNATAVYLKNIGSASMIIKRL